MPREDTEITAPHSEAQGVGFGAQTPDNWSTPPKTVAAALDAAAAGELGTYVEAHAMLDGSAHSDSVADGVTRGSLIYGNATPKWDELVVGGANEYLRSNGLDAAWGALDISHDTTPTLGGNLAGAGKTISNVLRLQVTDYADIAELYLTGDKITDSNANEVLLFSAAASAVNEITITNAATTVGPIIAASGTDANIDLNIASKGTGDIVFDLAGAEVARFFDAGGMVMGKVAPVNVANSIELHVEAAGCSTDCFTYSATVNHQSVVRLRRARGTIASPTIVSAGDKIGAFNFVQYNGAAWATRASVAAEATGADVAQLLFKTGSGAGASTRFSIAGTGACRVASTNHLEFNDASAYIYSPSAADLTITATDLYLNGGGVTKIEGGTDVQFWEGTVEQVNIADQNMVFHPASGTDTRFDFGANGTMKMYTGAAIRFSYNATGFIFNSGVPIAQPDIVGARNNNEGAFKDLLTKLALLGLVTDSSTEGDAWVDTEWLGVNAIKAPGTKPATYKDHGISGVHEFSDGTDDTVVFDIMTPAGMDRTVAPTLKIGWSTHTTVTTETCTWQLEYLWTSPGEDTTAAAQGTLTVDSNAIAQADGLIVAEITGIDVPSETDVCIHCRLKRLGEGGNDDLTDTAELHGVCLSYAKAEGRS